MARKSQQQARQQAGQYRQFFNEVVSQEKYDSAKTELFNFCTSHRDWWANGAGGDKAIAETVQQALRTNTNATLSAAWTLVGPKLEQFDCITEKLVVVNKRLRESQKAYLQELTQLKDQYRANAKRGSVGDFVPDFNEDLEFFDATQYYDDDDKEVIKLIVEDKIKTAVSRALGGKVDAATEGAQRRKDAELKAKNDNLLKEMDTMRERLDKLQKEHSEEKSKNEELQTEISTLSDEMNARIAEFQVQVEQLEDEKGNLELLLEEERARCEELREQNGSLVMEIDLLKEDVLKAQENAMTALVELDDCKQQLEKSTAAAEKFEEEKQRIEAEAKAYSEASAAREKQLNARVQELEDQLAEALARADKLEACVADLKRQYMEEKAKRQEADTLLKAARQALKLAQKRTEELENENVKLRTKSDDLELRLEELHESIHTLRAEGAQAGCGPQIERLLEKTGLQHLKKTRNVFSRLYTDAMERLRRMEEARLEILRLQRETMAKVLSAKQLVSPEFRDDSSLTLLDGPMFSEPRAENNLTDHLTRQNNCMSASESKRHAKSTPVIETIQSRAPPFVDKFPSFADRSPKRLEPIDKKVRNLKRHFSGNLGSYGDLPLQ